MIKISVFDKINDSLIVDAFNMSFKEEAVTYFSRKSRSSGQSIGVYASLYDADGKKAQMLMKLNKSSNQDETHHN